MRLFIHCPQAHQPRSCPRMRASFSWTAPDLVEGGEALSPSTAVQPTTGARAPRRPVRTAGPDQPARLSILWWVFLTNASVVVVAVLLLALTPITVSAPIALREIAVLVAGLVAMLVVNLFLLRRVLAPVLRLTHAMSSVDPDYPGRRLAVGAGGSAEAHALAEAFNEMLGRLEAARREAAGAALMAQEAERLRVARELHDEIGQTLTAVIIQVERAADTDAAAASDALRRVSDALRDSLDDVRRIARELRPEALDDLGLLNALIALCSRLDRQGETRVSRDLQGKLPPLSADVELVVYRVAQEALTNAIRHARATRATVSLRADAEQVALVVSDDGDGMPVPLPTATAGLSGMRERALLVGGRLRIESRPGAGTQIRLDVPSGVG
jgi:two-component system, NarL family, sensor histidine kinase UhpB